MMRGRLFGAIFGYRRMVEDREEELLEQWRRASKLPRKAKKKARKVIRLDWSINEYVKTLLY